MRIPCSKEVNPREDIMRAKRFFLGVAKFWWATHIFSGSAGLYLLKKCQLWTCYNSGSDKKIGHRPLTPAHNIDGRTSL